MTFGEAVTRFWSRYADFSGRATRAEYFYAWLFNAIVNFGLEILYAAGDSFAVSAIGLIWTIATLIPGISLTVRRLHDTNKSGAIVALQIVCGVLLLLTSLAYLSEGSSVFVFAVVIFLVILVGLGIYLLVAVFSDTAPGRNKYGDSEKYPENFQLKS